MATISKRVWRSTVAMHTLGQGCSDAHAPIVFRTKKVGDDADIVVLQNSTERGPLGRGSGPNKHAHCRAHECRLGVETFCVSTSFVDVHLKNEHMGSK